MLINDVYETRRRVLRGLIEGPPWNNNQRAFAQAVGKAPQQISDILAARRAFGEGFMLGLCDVLGLPPYFFNTCSGMPTVLQTQIRDPATLEILSLLSRTDETGRQMALGAVIATLQHRAAQGTALKPEGRSRRRGRPVRIPEDPWEATDCIPDAYK